MIGFNNKEEDMSMEDILSSIRKYVAEEDLSKTNKTKEYTDDNNHTDSSIIELDECSVSDKMTSEFQEEKSLNETPQSGLNNETTSSPFNKLAEALKSYGKPKKAQPINFNMPVNQFFTAIVEEYIKKWVAENLKQLAESIILREIEKLKSEKD